MPAFAPAKNSPDYQFDEARRARRRSVGRALAVLVAATCLIGLVYAIAESWWRNRNFVVLDNESDMPMALKLDGVPAGELRAHSFREIRDPVGEHSVEARVGGEVVEQGRFAVDPPRDDGTAVRQVYNLGGFGRYGLATVCYGYQGIEGCEGGVRWLARTPRLFRFPADVSPGTTLDERFPHKIQKIEHAKFRLHLCHAGQSARGVRCPVTSYWESFLPW